MASATLRIRLLGELDLRRDEVAVPPLGSVRAESLLAYLLDGAAAPAGQADRRQRPAPAVPVPAVDGGRRQPARHARPLRSQRVPELTDEVIDVVCGLTDTITSPLSYTAGFVMGGTAGQVDPDATAVGERGNGFELSIVAGWPPTDPGGDRHTAWVRQGWTDLRPSSTGVYSHFLSGEGAAGVQAAYGERLKRLTALKDRYDPANLFRMNANIPPRRSWPSPRASRRRCAPAPRSSRSGW
jgi:hypothetical protein